MALAYTVRDRMLHRYIATLETIADAHIPIKVVAYLSAEFLTGPTHRTERIWNDLQRMFAEERRRGI